MSSNPLQQYFRRPTIYFSLPSGGRYYQQEVLEIPPNGQFPVYPMTAIDEITARTPDALYNGSAIVNIIHSCVPNIKNAWEINTIDFDAVLVAVRIATVGDEMDIESKCPACQEESKYGVNLIAILNSQVEVNYDELLSIGDLKIKFRPLTYREVNQINLSQFEVRKILSMLDTIESEDQQKEELKKNMYRLNSILTEMLAYTIECIITPDTTVIDRSFIIEYLQNCDKNTNNLIRDSSLALKEKNTVRPINIKCIHCQHEYNQSINLNVSDFFD